MNKTNFVSQFVGQFVKLEPLSLQHLSDLEKDFDPSLFSFAPKPNATVRQFIEENLELQKKGNFFPYAIILNSTGEAIGCTEISSIDEKNRKLRIGGSWLKKSFHGTAANSESKFLLLQHAFETLNMVRVQFTENVLNRRARAGIENIGGHYEGVARNSMVLPDGKLRDDARYSVIAKDWPGVKTSLELRIQKKFLPALT